MVTLKIFSDPINLHQIKDAVQAGCIAIMNTTRSNARSLFEELETTAGIPLIHLMVEARPGDWYDYIMMSELSDFSIDDANSLVGYVIDLWENEGNPNEYSANLYLLNFSERAKIALDRAPNNIKSKLKQIIDCLRRENIASHSALPSIYDKNVMVIRVDERFRLFYSKTSDHLNIVDIVDRSEYAHD
jgi:hypothetical protein